MPARGGWKRRAQCFCDEKERGTGKKKACRFQPKTPNPDTRMSVCCLLLLVSIFLGSLSLIQKHFQGGNSLNFTVNLTDSFCSFHFKKSAIKNGWMQARACSHRHIRAARITCSKTQKRTQTLVIQNVSFLNMSCKLQHWHISVCVCVFVCVWCGPL